MAGWACKRRMAECQTLMRPDICEINALSTEIWYLYNTYIIVTDVITIWELLRTQKWDYCSALLREN